ncbi:hypothetical protein RRG08_049086 [Elysia crispata]|uniref:Uncharacterized protein n=1 Tax=Elysia crispata TaxID=231223 RepID=A0AAE1AB17_9GAST|nr:hypothetical protein RRG08_049086 [Elysia crispata]
MILLPLPRVWRLGIPTSRPFHGGDGAGPARKSSIIGGIGERIIFPLPVSLRDPKSQHSSQPSSALS